MASEPQADAAAGGHKEHFLGFEMPDFSVLKDHNVQTIIYAKNVQKLGIATLSYGCSIYLAQQGASQIQVSLVAVTGYVAALMYGFQGGTIVDRMEKRTAMAMAYAAMAVLCFIFPTVFGTSVVDLIALSFLVSVLATISGPAIKATVAVVATPAAMATVAAMLNLFGSFGTAIGQAFVAPILINISGVEACMYVAGVVLFTGAVWSLRIPKEEHREEASQALHDVSWKPRMLDMKGIARWIAARPPIALMILVGSMVVALIETVTSLMPVYVRDVLDMDPVYSIYVFAPAGLAYLVGMITAPWLISRFGERRFGFASFAVGAVGIMMLGFIDFLAPYLAPFSPTRIFELFGADLTDKMLAAGFISMPANFGSTATGAAVQNYVNSRVPLAQQGGVFGMEKVIDNALTVLAMLSLGLVATWLGSQVVFVVAPILVLIVVIYLVRYSYRLAGEADISDLEVVEELWSGPDT